MLTTIDIESAFRDSATMRGLVLPNRLVADGALHRCGTIKKPSVMDGAYLLHLDGIAAGGFENHADGAGWENWCSRAENEMSDLEIGQHRQRMVAAKKLRDDEMTVKRARAAAEAAHIWNRSGVAGFHTYLTKKGIKPHGARVDGQNLVLSLTDIKGEIHSFQTIDPDGDKRFLSGGRKQGCFYAIGNSANVTTAFVTEGFATGASVYEATGIPVFVAFDCGNLRPVAEALRKRWPRAEIVICADDDAQTAGNPGVSHASAAAVAARGLVAIPKFGQYRTDAQTDFNDVHKHLGMDVLKQQLSQFIGPTFSPSMSRLSGEAQERIEESRHILRFGVKFLDDALGGIMRTDIVLIGARTGVGKTQMATIITKANCRAGKRVHYFALEAEDKEIERRWKYQILAGLYYKSSNGGHRPIRYLDWRMGNLEAELSQFDEQAEELLSAMCQNLHTYYKVGSFTSDDFAKHFADVQENTDLVVLDLFSHVDSDDENDNRAAKKIIHQIRIAALRAKRPVVIIGHVRKTDPRFGALVPTEEDFNGSKELVNTATKAIMIAPDYGIVSDDPALWSTFVKVVKCRTDSSVTRYCARVVYDLRSDSYRQEYALGRLTGGGKEWADLTAEQIPSWKNDPRSPAIDSVPLGDDE
jgi:phage/plasmid primase-like uncharacterized protein